MKRIFILMILYTQFLFAYEYAEGFDEAFINSCTKTLSKSSCVCRKKILKNNVPYQEIEAFTRESIKFMKSNGAYDSVSLRYRKTIVGINNCGR